MGGAERWYIGSAVDQNKIPTAVFVQRAIAIHEPKLKRGFALFPPIFTFPTGITHTRQHTMRTRKPVQVKSIPKFPSIQLLSPLVWVTNSLGLQKENRIATTKRTKGGQNTQARSCLLWSLIWFLI
jgi:hypothetical protein